MRAFLCICAAGIVASTTGCMSSQGYMMNQAGQTFYQRGNYAQAALEFQRAMAANPHNADYAANLAAALKKQGNLPAAEQTWRQALNMNPSHQPSYHGLAQLLVEGNRQNEAMAMLGSWGSSQPYSAEPQIEMAWLNRELGNASGAAQSLQQALQINPNHPKALAAMGQHYQDTGKLTQAVTMYQQSLRSDWYQPEIQSRLATLKGFEAPEQTPRAQLAQAFNTVPNMTMQFPPTPQFARRTFGPQLAANQNPYAAATNRLSQVSVPQYPIPQVAQQFSAPQVAQQFQQPAFPPVSAPQPSFANVPTPDPFAQSFPPSAEVSAAVANMIPQPAATEYPVTQYSATASQVAPAGSVPFAGQFINQAPNAYSIPATPTQNAAAAPIYGTPGYGAPTYGSPTYGAPTASSVTTAPQTYAPPIGAIQPGINADPAHVPQISAVPEVQPF